MSAQPGLVAAALMDDDSSDDDEGGSPAAPAVPAAPPPAPAPLAVSPYAKAPPPVPAPLAPGTAAASSFVPVNPASGGGGSSSSGSGARRRSSPSDRPRAGSGGGGGTTTLHLQTLLQDVVQQLDKDARVQFRNFVQDLKKQRDSGAIPSLSDALLKGGAAVVGMEVWNRACAKQMSQRGRGASGAGGGGVGDEERERARLEQQRRLEHEEKRRRLEREAAERALQLEAAPEGSSLAEEVQQQTDLLSNGDLNIQAEAAALSKRATSGHDAETDYSRWDSVNLVDEPTASRRLQLAAERCVHLPGVAAKKQPAEVNTARARRGAKGAKGAVARSLPSGLTHDDDNAQRPARELLSRAAQLYARDALEALVVLSQRRRNEEARRIATNPETCGLAVRWLDRDVEKHVVNSRRACEKRDALLDAMVDHDILNSPPVPHDEPPATSTWARAKRAREMELDRTQGLDGLGYRLERGIVKVKAEEDRDEKRSKLTKQIPEQPDKITKADVKHLLRSRRQFSKLLF